MIPPDLKFDLEHALEQLSTGVRDPAAAKKACDRMDRLREENRGLFGEQSIAVQLIREARNAR